MKLQTTGLLAALMANSMAFAVGNDLLDHYQRQGAGTPSAEAGQAAWVMKHGSDGRSCASCHGADLRKPGRHAKTGKTIKPMAPSVNAARLTDGKKVEKWFKRNCRWTLGRECTAREKVDYIQFIMSL